MPRTIINVAELRTAIERLIELTQRQMDMLDKMSRIIDEMGGGIEALRHALVANQ